MQVARSKAAVQRKVAKIVRNNLVGLKATICHYSDREVAEVIESTRNTITLRELKSTLLNGPDSGEPDALKVTPGGFCAHWEGVQRYRYESDPNGRIYKATLRKDGKWRLVGATNYAEVKLGVCHKFYDYNF